MNTTPTTIETTRTSLTKRTWLGAALVAISTAIGIFLILARVPVFQMSAILIFFLGLPLLFGIYHARVVLGPKRAGIFLMLAFFLGLLAEYLGLRDGIIFGGFYQYTSGPFLLFGVPFFIPLYWVALTYVSYSFTNSFLECLYKKKPKNGTNFLWVPLLAVLDGLFIFLIDIVLDPIAVRMGVWHWLERGNYYGVPYGNFFGWFVVTVVITFLFRTVEYFFPQDIKRNSSISLIPLLGIGMLFLVLVSQATVLRLTHVAVFGLLLVAPFIVFNIVLSIRFFLKKAHGKWPTEKKLSHALKKLFIEEEKS